MTPTEFILTAIAGALIGFGAGIWYALRFRKKQSFYTDSELIGYIGVEYGGQI
jgi:hypothetical protein|tara:strand:- start:476 stop:634 length:159 start_codon:yes stop_codon:yes gene_type:complete